jgi:type VI secretion system protein VasJ
MPSDASSDPRLALGRDPIEGNAPAGTDVRGQVEFESLEEQIRVMEAGGSNAADWKFVIRTATAILQTQAKDMLVASYLAYALWREEKLSGLAVGILILRDLTLAYWPDAQPPPRRTRARVSLFEWLNGRVGRELAAEGDSLPISPDAVLARDAVKSLSAFLREMLGDEAPAIGELERALRPLAEKFETQQAQAQAAAAKAEEAKEAAARPPPPPPTTSVSPAATSTAEPAPISDDPARSLLNLRESIRRTGLALLTQNHCDPRAYAMLAHATWLPLEVLPVNEGGRTSLPPPGAERLADILSRRGGDAKALLLEVETFCSGPGLFWLDGQYLISQSLGRLGEAAAAAKRSHEESVALFLLPFPGIEKLAYNNGTLFANDATSHWLQGLAAGGSGSGETVEAVPAWARAAAAAQEFVSINKPDDAFAVLAEGAHTAQGQEKARWLAEGLRLCVRVPDIALGSSLARHLTTLAASHQLADWDAKFAAEIFDLALQCIGHRDAVRFVPPPERQRLLTDWSTELARLNITRGRLVLKDFVATI